MIKFIHVEIDQNKVRELFFEKLEEKIKTLDAELVFWDSRELKRRTCMSWNTIQKEFFYHPDFPKYKIGGKWYFPAEETKQFLLRWLSER